MIIYRTASHQKRSCSGHPGRRPNLHVDPTAEPTQQHRRFSTLQKSYIKTNKGTAIAECYSNHHELLEALRLWVEWVKVQFKENAYTLA